MDSGEAFAVAGRYGDLPMKVLSIVVDEMQATTLVASFQEHAFSNVTYFPVRWERVPETEMVDEPCIGSDQLSIDPDYNNHAPLV